MQFGGPAGRGISLTRSGLRPHIRCNAASSSSSSAAAEQPQARKGSLVGAALVSGSMSVTGDLLAQFITRRSSTNKDSAFSPADYDWQRAARMGGFGLCLYGPFQHWWYGLLDRQFPLKKAAHFLSKNNGCSLSACQVALNQVVLGPLVVSSAFTWNLYLTRQQHLLRAKLQRDLVPSVTNGWKLWIPAACVNFFVVPVQYQVVWMSSVSVLWTAYLSFASNNK